MKTPHISEEKRRDMIFPELEVAKLQFCKSLSQSLIFKFIEKIVDVMTALLTKTKTL